LRKTSTENYLRVNSPDEVDLRQDTYENEELVFDHPPICQTQYSFENGIGSFCFSQRGESHIKSNTPCQDRCAMKMVRGQSIVVMAIADGVGSCELSDFGADWATQVATQYLYEEISELTRNGEKNILDNETVGRILRGAMELAYNEVSRRAQEMEQIFFLFQSTLTLVIFDGKDLYFSHAGDDGIVVLTSKGRLVMATTRHKGDEASSVYPLQSKTTWQFGKVEDVVAIVMATDGVLDSFVMNSFENNRIYYPFLERIFTSELNSLDCVQRLCNYYFSIMEGAEYRKKVTDDMTFGVIVNQNTLSKTRLPKFDKVEWEDKTREYTQMRREALYPSNKKDTHQFQKEEEKEEEEEELSFQDQDDSPLTYPKPEQIFQIAQRPDSCKKQSADECTAQHEEQRTAQKSVTKSGTRKKKKKKKKKKNWFCTFIKKVFSHNDEEQ